MPEVPEEKEYIVSPQPVHCDYTLASARWARDDLVLSLMKATEPPGWIHRGEAEALADAIIAATNQEVAELPPEANVEPE